MDYIASQTLKWVTKGSGKNDPESVIIFTPQSDGMYKIATNTGVNQRFMLVKVNGSSQDADTHNCAVRAKALEKIADKVDEDTAMSIQLKEDKVILSSGATSFTLDNLYEATMIVPNDAPTALELTVDYDNLIPAISRAQNIGKSSDIVLGANKEENTITIVSGDEEMRSQETYTASPGDDFNFIIPSAHFKAISASSLKKIEPEDITIRSGHGLLEFDFSLSAGESTSVVSFSYIFPTLIGKNGLSDNPCENDIIPVFTIERSALSSAINYVSAATRGETIVILDASQGPNYVNIKVEDNDGYAQTTIVDASIDAPEVIVVSAELILKALKSITGDQAVIGTFDENDAPNWLSITPVFDEDAESESDNSDIVVAVKGE